MKLIELSQGRFTKVSDIDFERVSTLNWVFDGRYAKAVFKNPKAKLKRDKGGQKCIYLHRFVLNLYNEDLNPKIQKSGARMEVDHKNGDKLDNQRENLRIVTCGENKANMKKRSSKCLSKFKGVSFTTIKNFSYWTAQISKEKKYHRLGYFKKEEDAARAYNKAAKLLYGDLAWLNDV